MGSVFHRFKPDEEGRCTHLMRDGGACARLDGSHQTDTRRKRKEKRRGGDRHKNRPEKSKQPFVFWDDEGKDFKIGKRREHRLIYGAGVSETGELIHEIKARGGRQPAPAEWLDALLEVGRKIKQRSIFAYGFGYDRTMMLRGLPPKILYQLTRREDRPTYELRGRKCFEPLYWGDYVLDLQGTRFSVAKVRRLPDGRYKKDARGRRTYDRITVWDILKFFQCSFVDALDAWRWKGELCRKTPENLESELVISQLDLDEMRHMKAHRADFDKMPWSEVKKYCKDEGKNGARLVRELVTACTRIGIKLRRFDGAGSISDALMQKHEVGRFMSAKSVGDRILDDSILKRKFLHAVMCAFAGGRFETSCCGIVRKEVHVKDITGAYPYAKYLHPCLACGKWEHLGDGKTTIRNIDRRVDRASLALLRVECEGKDKLQAFGSFHHRDRDGNVTFPLNNRTWTWAHEYRAARDAMGDRVRVTEAYLYTTACDHHPFRFMGQLYLERLRIGKEGRGIAMKLGYNGCAGKTMQRVGSHRWQEYIWAGNTTARTRAMLLEAIGRFHDQWDVCYVATDSVFATRDITFPEPEDTGTKGAAAFGKPPLGGWEPGKAPYSAMCFVRPGIAFPLNATEEQLKEIKARGISKSVLLENIAGVVELMQSQEVIGGRGGELKLQRRIFGGMKMCTQKSGKPAVYALSNADEDSGESRYGKWYEQKIRVGIGARPKRFARMPSEEGMLFPWPDPPVSASTSTELATGAESLAYGATKTSEEARKLQELQDCLAEQPNLGEADDFHGGEM